MDKETTLAMAVLQQYERDLEYKQLPSKFLEPLTPFLPSDPNRRNIAEQVVTMFERALVSHSENRCTLARLCALIQALTVMKTGRLAVILAGTSPDLIRSTSWVSKLIKAGHLLNQWPSLGDITSVDKLATLWRVPRTLQSGIFEAGMLPDGSSIRELRRDALAEAVNRLRVGRAMPISPHRQARRELHRLIRQFSPITGQLSGLAEFGPIHAKLLAVQAEILSSLEMMPIPRHPQPSGLSQILQCG